MRRPRTSRLVILLAALAVSAIAGCALEVPTPTAAVPAQRPPTSTEPTATFAPVPDQPTPLPFTPPPTSTVPAVAFVTDTRPPSATATATMTHPPTATVQPSATATAQPTASATEAPTIYYVAGKGNINVRGSATTTAGILGTIAPGAAVEILETVDGQFVLGSLIWYEINFNGDPGYVHSSLLTDRVPTITPIATIPPTRRPVTAGPISTRPPSATRAPVQQQQPAAPPPVQEQEPAPPQPQQPAAPAFGCDCGKSCPAMASCEEAYFQLNTCGCGRRDSDSDGVPCEDICPGG